MRKLVITRGAQGTGKSTFLKESGLDGYILSADEIRLMLGAPVLTQHGNVGISQDQNQRGWEMLRQFSDERMSRGETLAVDLTLASRGDAQFLLKLARDHLYRVALVDFSGVPLEMALANNRMRPTHKVVSDFVIQRDHARIAEHQMNEKGIHVIRWSADGSHLAALRRWLEEPILNFSHYESVMHIGDLQGCLTVLIDKNGPLAGGLRDNVRYVFVGDLVDRGVENGAVVRWFVDHALRRDNVDLLWGNHEDHLHRWAKGIAGVSAEFNNFTLPQLNAARVTQAEAAEICAKARDFLAYSYGDERVLVTHAGLSTAPERPELISRHQYSRGTGHWQDPVDEQFERNAPHGWTQVHGHRNHGWRPVRATERSFNLEGQVEFGGHLRVATLSRDGWSTSEHRNRIFKPFREREHGMWKIVPAWMSSDDGKRPFIEPTVMAAMRTHAGVREKVSESRPHVSSFNFTKQVFFDKAWDDVVVKARGLFFNNRTGGIVARAYDKFFNVGERPETTMEGLKDHLAFPVRLYVKENGYLGLLGYDSERDDLFFASKSSPDTDYARWFSEIFEQTVDPGRREVLRRFLRDTDSCAAFEVNDPIRDPHMIEYVEPHVVLLDVFRRSMDLQKLGYDELCEVGKRFGLKVKERAITFKDWPSFEGWMKASAENYDYKHGGRHIEGFVLEDSAGFQTKVKLAYYTHWKRMRSLKDRVLRRRQKGLDLDWQVQDPRAAAFRDWVVRQDDATLLQDIIVLRKQFESEMDLSETSAPRTVSLR